jgi:hypothetical protein
MGSIGSAVMADTGCQGGRNLGQEVVADAKALEGADVPGSDKFVTRSAKGSIQPWNEPAVAFRGAPMGARAGISAAHRAGGAPTTRMEDRYG